MLSPTPIIGISFEAITVILYFLCWEKARAVFRWFLPLLELDISPQLVQNIKLCELATGLGTGHVRKPRLPLTGEALNKVEKVIAEGMANRPQNLDYKKYL